MLRSVISKCEGNVSANKKTFSQDILGGKAEIYKMSRSGDVYQFRMWIQGERKYVRKSLKTRDLPTAIDLAENEVFRIHSDVSSGRKLFGISLGELVEKYLEWRKKDVETGLITQGRLITIKSQCNALLRIKPEKLKVAELNENSFYDWRQMRVSDNPTITNVTIRNEIATIKQIFDFAYRNGYSHIPRLEFRTMSIKGDEIGRRSIFTLEEYDQLIGLMRSYASKKNTSNYEEYQLRQMVRNFIFALSNTCLRVGELRQMKWSDILGYEDRKDERDRDVTLIKIHVRKEISKVRRSRVIISRGGEYFKRQKRISDYNCDDDFIFPSKSGKHPIATRDIYSQWNSLMNGIGITNHKERKLTYYSLRHFGITMRLRVGVSIWDVAELAGTSVSHIEKHYGHHDDMMKISAALKNMSITREGIGELYND